MLFSVKNDHFLCLFRTVKSIYSYIFLFALLFMRSIVPVSTRIPGVVDSLVFSFLALAGCLIIAVDFFTAKDMFRMKYWYLLAAFVVVMLISAVVNRQYEFFGNIKTIIFCAIQFFVFLSVTGGSSREKIKKTIRVTGDLLAAFMLVCSVISIVQFAFQIGYTVEVGDKHFYQGFYESRLFGVYQDPNYASITGIISVFLCMYNFTKVKNLFFRIFYIVNIIVQFMYTVMSGSRTAEVCLLVTIFIGAFFVIRKYCFQLDFKRVTAVVVSLFLGISCALTVYFTIPASKFVLQFAPSLISSEQTEPVTFERADVEGNPDISNLRFKIWESGLEIYTGHPVFGTSPRAQLAIAHAEYPDGFVAQRNYMLHNGYLNVLVSTGTVGAAVMLSYIILVVALVCKKFFGKGRKNYDPVALTALLVVTVMAIASLFLTEIFFVNTACAWLFWFFLGIVLRLCVGDTSARQEFASSLPAEAAK